jgi:hypothetical protein
VGRSTEVGGEGAGYGSVRIASYIAALRSSPDATGSPDSHKQHKEPLHKFYSLSRSRGHCLCRPTRSWGWSARPRPAGGGRGWWSFLPRPAPASCTGIDRWTGVPSTCVRLGAWRLLHPEGICPAMLHDPSLLFISPIWFGYTLDRCAGKAWYAH